MKTILSATVIVCALSPIAARWWLSCRAIAAETVSLKADSATARKPASADERPGPVVARSICYGWKAGYRYTYRVKANTERYDSEESLDGTVAYTVKSVNADGLARVKCTESFTRSTKNRDDFESRTTANKGHSSFFKHHSNHEETFTIVSAPDEIEIDRRGRIVGAEREGNLPFPVGHLSHLAIEPLSAVDESEWSISGDVGIVLTERAETLASPLGVSREGLLRARERTTYSIKASHGRNISVRKTYGFATVAEADGNPRLTITGDGELDFDRQTGVFASSTMKLRVILREDDSPEELVTMVNCGLSPGRWL